MHKLIRDITVTDVSDEGICAGAVTSVQRCRQKVLEGFEPTTLQLASECLATRPPGNDLLDIIY